MNRYLTAYLRWRRFARLLDTTAAFRGVTALYPDREEAFFAMLRARALLRDGSR